MADLQRLTVRVLGDVTDLRSKMSKAEKATEQFGYNMKRAGRTLTVGLTLPITAVGVAATKLASDAIETANKFDVVFGPAADRLRERFEELHPIIPATREEMERMASGVQDLLVPLGITRDEAADMSLAMLELGADIASFNNVATPQVLEAFKSALAGQSRPLRQFGINVLDARLKTIALEEGLLDASGAMDTTARAQAVLIAATRDSRDAIGDAARTAGDAAQQFKFFMRNVKELGTTIGEQLLPVVTPMVDRLNETLTSMDGLGSSTVQWAISIAAVAATLGPLLLIGGKALQMFTALKVATAGLSVAMGLSTGGLAFVVMALVGVLGFLSTAYVKSKLEAAEFAASLRNVTSDARKTANALEDMDKAQIAGLLTGRLDALDRMKSERQQMIAEQREGLASSGLPGIADRSDEWVAGTFGETQQVAFRNLERAISSTSGAVAGLLDQLDQLDEAGGGGGGGGEGGILGAAVNIAGLEIGRVMDRVESLSERLARLQHDAAFADTTEDAAKLREEIEATERALNRAVDAAGRITVGGIGGISPEVGMEDSGAFGVGEQSADFRELLREMNVSGGFDMREISVQRGIDPDTGEPFGDEEDPGVMDAVMGPLKQFGPLALAAGVAFEILKGAMEPLQPVFDALKEPLAIIGILIGQNLAPILELLVPVVEAVAIVFSLAQEAVGWFIKGLGWVINKLLGWLTSWGKKLEAFGDDMIENSRAARAEIGARRDSEDAIRETTRVLNAPRGFKDGLEQRLRFNATGATGGGGGGGGNGGGSGGGGGGGNVPPLQRGGGNTFHVSVNGDRNPREMWRDLKQGIREAADSGDPDALALGF